MAIPFHDRRIGKIVFHGTSEENAKQILQGGLRVTDEDRVKPLNVTDNIADAAAYAHSSSAWPVQKPVVLGIRHGEGDLSDAVPHLRGKAAGATKTISPDKISVVGHFDSPDIAPLSVNVGKTMHPGSPEDCKICKG